MMTTKQFKKAIKEAAIRMAAINNQPSPKINTGKLKIFIMKPTTVLLFVFCCVAHLCGWAQSGPNNNTAINYAAYKKPITTADSCYEYVDSISVEYGFRSTNVRYKLLVRDAITREKFVMTLYSNYDGWPTPAPMPKGIICVTKNYIEKNKRAYKVDTIK